MRSHVSGEENEIPFIRVWKPLPNIRVLKTLRGSPKEKAQSGQYLVAVGLSRYIYSLRFYMHESDDCRVGLCENNTHLCMKMMHLQTGLGSINIFDDSLVSFVCRKVMFVELCTSRDLEKN